jgi:hypothetical protein
MPEVVQASAMGRRREPQAGDEQDAAAERHPARAVPVGQDAGEGLAQSPGDLLHGDGEREVGDGDPQLPGGRCLEQAEILPDAHGQGHHQGGSAQHGVGLATRNLGNVKGFAHGR